MRIALIGAGAIGTIAGALISKGGEDIVLVDSYKDHVDAMNNRGATITGCLDENIPVKAILPGEMDGVYDLIITLTKQTGLVQCLEEVRKNMHPGTMILTLQNGIPEDIACGFVSRDRIMGGGVEFSATFVSPGVSRLTCAAMSLGVTFGSLEGPVDDRVRAVGVILSHIGHVKITTNLLGVRYSKLTDNSVFSAIPTALNCELGKVLDNDDAMKVVAHAGREAARIIARMGLVSEVIFGFQPTLENLDFNSPEEMKRVIDGYWRPIYSAYRQQVASMLQDIRKGIKCEINFINGKFVDKGRELGIATPYMSKLVEIITKLQDKVLPLESAWDNLESLRALGTD
ncbi:MAG: ketopantoate reductase family protein [Spirochaetales bacterium]|nr:MAG: ketopantoate reductase family protein [Spirochaetales bacterium]